MEPETPAVGAAKSSSMIEDQELRELFAAESEEHLHQLESGLLHLEKHPDDMEVLKELFREAHSLKGAARMLGVRDVETLAHHFEDFLGAASKGQRTFTALDVDRLTRGLDDIRALVEEAVTGKRSPIALPEALQRLTQPVVAPQPKENPPAAPVSPAVVPPVSPPGGVVSPASMVASRGVVAAGVVAPPPVPRVASKGVVAAGVVAPPPVSVQQTDGPARVESEPAGRETGKTGEMDGLPPVVEGPPDGVGAEGVDPLAGSEEAAPVIRVRSNKLDALLRLVGELTVVRTRVKRRLAEIEEILVSWEDQSRHESGGSREGAGIGLTDRTAAQDETTLFGNRLLMLRHGIVEDEAGLELVSEALEEGIRNLRLLPLSTLFGQFPRLVRDLARQQDKEVVLLTEGGETTADKRILEEMKNPLMHLIRNAVDHGLEGAEQREKGGKPRSGTVTLRATQTATHVVLEVRDDGRGLDLEAIRRQARKRGLFTEEALAAFSAEQLYAIIFQSGFSTATLVTDVSGRGVGLDVVRVQVERLKGRIQVTSVLHQGSCFTIALPVTLATTPVFIASANGQLFAIPLDFVHSVRRVVPEEIFPIEGCDTIVFNGRPVSVARLARLLELPPSSASTPDPPWPCIMLNLGSEGWLGVICDTLEDELEVVLKPFGGLLHRVRNLSGTTILGSGQVCVVVNPQDLLLTVRKLGRHLSESMTHPAVPVQGLTRDHPPGTSSADQGARRKTILLAEDSLTTCTQEKRILQGAGYEVIAAVDGMDALNKLGKQPVDAVVSDVQMPNLDGLALAQKIRQNPLYKDLPIILVTSLSSDEDMRRGMEVGANAYITKPTFEQTLFLETLQRLV